MKCPNYVGKKRCGVQYRDAKPPAYCDEHKPVDWKARALEAEQSLANCREFIKEIPLEILTAVHEQQRLKRLIKAASLDED